MINVPGEPLINVMPEVITPSHVLMVFTFPTNYFIDLLSLTQFPMDAT